MRIIKAISAEPGDVLRGCYPGHNSIISLPEMDEQIIVSDFARGLRFHGRVIGLNHGRHTYVVKVGEAISDGE